MAAPTVTDFDATPPVYALPESNVLEPGVIARDGGLEYTFADQGTQESFECPDAPGLYYHVRTFQRVASSAFPRCWKLVTETERLGDCKTRPSIYDPSPDDAVTPVDPEFDEHSPTGPVDGPGEGPGQGTPADKP
jgi:hypothetical protein